MKVSKIFGIFKKGAKTASKRKGKTAEDGFSWPPGMRLGVYGHANSGKTVYFTVLNEECKISKDVQISVTDSHTAGEFLSNYRCLWGLGTAADSGTVVDLRGEKKFPEPTKGDRILQFGVVLDRDKKLSVVSYDYDGGAVSISGRHEIKDKVVDFMSGCDGILFFFDPKVLGAELQTQAHVASFVNILEHLASLGSRIPIPIALVITKADILPGFTGEGQAVLINAEDEHLIAEDFDFFLEKVLNSSRITSNPAWAGSVRNVLVKLREFLRIVMGRTLDFQIFFISNTGESPQKIGADVGRSIYAPPSKIRPVGVKEPFYWLLKSILRSKRISGIRRLAKIVAVVCLVWIALYSIPFLYHFKLLYPQPIRVEESVLKTHAGSYFSTDESERKSIIDAYRKYADSWLVRKLYPGFILPAKKMQDIYREFDLGKAVSRLNGLISDFARTVADSSLWPKINPVNDSLILASKHQEMLAGLDELHAADAGSLLGARTGRTLVYWDLFTKYLTHRDDTVISGAIIEQVDFDRANVKDYNTYETQLGDALKKIAQRKKQVVAQKMDSREALTEYESLKERINNSSEPAFLLDKAVRDLKNINAKLDAATDAEQIAAINSYIKETEKWNERRRFTYKIDAVPEMGHLHIEVTAKGADPAWATETQMLEGDEFTMEWKLGDDIHIAFDELKHKCQWGKLPSDKKVLTGKYSIFDMEGNITFSNIGKTVTISFKPSLSEQLPKLK
jgi:hypothetical protein